MQPLGGDGEPPEQPRDKDEDDHDEERRSDAGGGGQDHGGQQPATPKRTTERQYLARLMCPLAPNRNSNRSPMRLLHEKRTGRPAHGNGTRWNEYGFKA